MSSTPVDTSSFLHYSEAVFTAGTIEGASDMILSQHAVTSGAVRHLCGICGQSLGRPQDLRRHVRDKHRPRHQCPFCPYEWTRPDRMKAHIMDVHRDVFSPQILQGICNLRGQAVIEFLETYEILRSVIPEI